MARLTKDGHWTVIGCRAAQLGTRETCALLQRPSSIRQCRRAAGHRVRREIARAGTVAPTPLLFRSATQASYAKTISGPETTLKLLRDCWLDCKEYCRKTCFTSE